MEREFLRQDQQEMGIELMLRRGYLKEGETIEPEDVLNLIDDGKFSLEALVYECKGFNWEMYKWLSDTWDAQGLAIKQMTRVRPEPLR